MQRFRGFKGFLFLMVFLPVLVVGRVTIPSGYEKVVSEIGVDLYSNIDRSVFVQVIDLKAEGKVQLELNKLNGVDYTDANTNKKEFEHLEVKNIFDKINNSNLFSVSNAGDMTHYKNGTTDCSLGKKFFIDCAENTMIVDSLLINNEYFKGDNNLGHLGDTPRLLLINTQEKSATVREITHNELKQSNQLLSYTENYDQVLVGKYQDLDENQWKDDKGKDPRTAFGVIDANDDHEGKAGDTIIILVGRNLTLVETAKILMNFGVINNSSGEDKMHTKLMIGLLDSGSSSQIYTQYKKYNNDTTTVISNSITSNKNRPIPESLLVYKGFLNANENNCPINYTPFNDGGGIYMHELNGIELQNCKQKYEGTKELAVFENGYIVELGFWEKYKERLDDGSSFGIQYLGKPKEKAHNFENAKNMGFYKLISCQTFENGTLFWHDSKYNSKDKALYSSKSDLSCRDYEEKTFIFTDVFEGDDYADAIYELYNRLIIQGYEGGSFKPSNKINRAEFLKILMLAQKFPEKDTIEITDITSFFHNFNDNIDNNDKFIDLKNNDHWYAKYANSAKQKGYVEGVTFTKEPYKCTENDKKEWGKDDKPFCGAREINFAEAAKITVNTLIEETKPATTGNWFDPFINKLKLKGITDIDPAHEITRAEMAYIIAKVKGWIE